MKNNNEPKPDGLAPILDCTSIFQKGVINNVFISIIHYIKNHSKYRGKIFLVVVSFASI